MFIPFDQLRDDARIWIFQSDKLMNDQETAFISEQLKIFTHQWEAHKKPLNSSFAVLHNSHVVVGVDQSVNDASGCSIDSLVHLIQKIGQQLNINFFDRKAIAYFEGEQVKIASFEEIRNLIEKQVITPDTYICNNLIPSKELLGTDWKVKAKNSWIKRYFKTASTT